jgi:hypothetical protein
MTQKSGLFKGQQKKDKAANRHGKDVHLRKGRVFKAPLKKNKELEANQVCLHSQIEQFPVNSK